MSDGEAMAHTTLDQLLRQSDAEGDARRYHLGSDWMQGRTAYGGISAAVALDAAMRAHLPHAPLRTAQVSFVGPIGGEVRVASRELRRSKSSLFVTAEVDSEAGFGTSATFSFMSPRTSHVDLDQLSPPDIADPDALEGVPDHPMRPAFTRKFDMRPRNGPGFGHAKPDADVVTWVRWVDEPAALATLSLLALGDALPPAAITLFREFGPVSSSTWTQHYLTEDPSTDDGWWLLSSRSHWVRRGFSVQEMQIWNRRRELVAVGSQGVALYV